MKPGPTIKGMEGGKREGEPVWSQWWWERRIAVGGGGEEEAAEGEGERIEGREGKEGEGEVIVQAKSLM